MPVFVNNIEITDDQVHSEMQHHPASSVEDARQEASRALIIRRLLLEAATDDKLVSINQLASLDEEKEELLIETLLDGVIQVPTADDDICQRYYDQNTQRFVDKETKKPIPYNMVKGHIKNYIEDKGHMSAFNAYIDSLMDKANIVGLA